MLIRIVLRFIDQVLFFDLHRLLSVAPFTLIVVRGVGSGHRLILDVNLDGPDFLDPEPAGWRTHESFSWVCQTETEVIERD